MSGDGQRPRFEPTPSEIRAACAEIQSEWSDAERLQRMRADARPVAAGPPRARLAVSEPFSDVL